MQPGLIATLLSRSHHVIQGRRGTGKSTVLQVLNHRANQENIPVAIVDMEHHKHRKYPDVLVEVLIDALDRLRPKPSHWYRFWQHARLRRQVFTLTGKLRIILQDPDVINRAVKRTRDATSKGQGKFALGKTAQVEASHTRSSHASNDESGSSDATKIERLRSLAPEVNRLLSRLVANGEARRSLIFIDDFYFINTDDQPYVLDYLHSVCKGTGVWLKVGGVGTRLKLYQEGDPPIGVQADQDVARLKLDVTLEDFKSAKSFLEKVLDGILQPVGMTTTDIMNDGARNRIVLACGGAVPRDYIGLALEALDLAITRMKPGESSVKIQTEDINRAAKRRTNQKEEEELKQDADTDAPKLRTRWQDIQAFANNRDQTSYVLLRQGDLTDTTWGKEIEQLENLRLLHRIGIAVPNTASWRQIRVVIMMIDLAAIMNQRLNANIVEFWKSQQEFDKLRRAQWVYSPDWNARGSAEPPTAMDQHDVDRTDSDASN